MQDTHSFDAPDDCTPRALPLLADAFTCLPDPAVVVDGSGAVCGWNGAAQRLLGWNPNDVLGQPVGRLLAASGRKQVAFVLDAVASGEEVEPFDAVCATKDGRHVVVRVRAAAMAARDGPGIVLLVQDEGRARHARAAERLAARRFRGIFESNVVGVCYGEHDRIAGGNAAFLKMIGSTTHDLRKGLAVGAVFPSESQTAEPFVDGVAREYEIQRADGASTALLAAGVGVGANAGWVGVVTDLTRYKAAERAIARLALHDPVTGLPNRRLLFDRLEHALARASRKRRSVAVLYCDVDHFKAINDSHGHRGGDIVLQTVARRLESVLRDDDTVARVGGDEFVVILEELADPREATRIAERARIAVNEAIAVDDTEVRVTTSVGVSLGSDSAEPVDTLIRRADDAMYVAKAAGRDRIAFAADELNERGAPSVP